MTRRRTAVATPEQPPTPDVSRNTILEGDALAVLRSLPSRSVQCVITSPPYYGLRNYNTVQLVNVKPDCAHDWRSTQIPYVSVCRACFGERHDKQYGLEPTLDDYLAQMVAVFDEVHRVLKPTGVCWLNIGDSYANDDKWGGATSGKHAQGLHGDTSIGREKRHTGFKPKDLMLVPFRLALALQTAGWWVRQTIIWNKPAPMPESVTDRCTTAHEYIFLLTRSERYYYDAAAIAEPATQAGKVVTLGDKSFSKGQAAGAGVAPSGNGKANEYHVPATRNRRSVWTVNTEPFPDAHYAVFPPALIEPMILAGSRPSDLVLDPFMGSGTVGVVAVQHGRDYLGIELSHEYAEMARQRIAEEGRPVVLARKQRAGMRKAGVMQSSLLDVAVESEATA